MATDVTITFVFFMLSLSPAFLFSCFTLSNNISGHSVSAGRVVSSAYLIGPFYAGANLTPALIPPVPKFALTPFRAAFNATQRAKGRKYSQWISLWTSTSFFLLFLKITVILINNNCFVVFYIFTFQRF